MVGYPSGWRGGIANPVGWPKVAARVRIPLPPPCLDKMLVEPISTRNAIQAFLRVRSLDHYRVYEQYGPIAQGLEQSAHNRLVPGSIPGGSTN